MNLTVATCQFPVSADIAANRRHVLRQMRAASEREAHVVHFCEAALSGYAGVDMPSHEGFDWSLLRAATEQILDEARRLSLWVLLGSAHPLSGARKPHNSVYVINPRGQLVDRYDKRFCAGDRSGRTGDLLHYSPGDHFARFTIRGVRCGVLICHDYRYPELYRESKRLGAQLVFHSFHAGNMTPERVQEHADYLGEDLLALNPSGTLPGITMPASLTAAAASSHVWISAANTSARESCWPSFFVRADGVVTGRLKRNVAGILVSSIDTSEPLYDSTVAWRKRAIGGVLHSGRLVRDARSENRTEL